MGIEEGVAEILQSRSEEGGFSRIQDILNPHRKKPYPMDHIGDFSRYPIEHRWKEKDLRGNENGWIDAEKLKDAVQTIDPGVATIRDINGFKEIADRALNLRADSAYRGEWNDVQQLGDIDKIIGENPAAAEANKIIADRILPTVLEKLHKGDTFQLADFGIGQLGTTKRIVAGVPPGLRKNLHVLGVDVMDDARRISTEMLTSSNPEYGGLPQKNVHMIESMFGQLHKNDKIWQYKRKVDGVVSGAAIHHQSHVRPFFETVYELLSPGGQMEIWDWLHKLWIGEVVKIGEYGNVSELYKQGLKEMAKVWVGLHGYDDKYKDMIEQNFDETIYKTGFNFHAFMNRHLVGADILEEKKTEFQSAEGHRDEYLYNDTIFDVFDTVVMYPIADEEMLEKMPMATLLHGFSAREGIYM